MNLGKLIRHLRILEKTSFITFNTMQWIRMKRVLSFHYKLLHLLMAIEQIHTILLRTFILTLSSTEKN